VKLQIKLEAMLDTKFRLLKDNIQTHIENRILGFKIHLHKMEDVTKELEKQKQSTQEGEDEANFNMRDRIKELTISP
jgi:hypothetical protein